MSDDPKAIDRELKAAAWPEAEYRAWVQSQIASRMLLTLGGLGVGTLILLSGSYFTLQNYVLRSNHDEIVTAVKDDLRPFIESEVLNAIVDKSDLVDDAKKQVGVQFEASIPELVRDEGFRAAASNSVFQALAESGGPQRLILDEALSQARDHGASQETRALGFQLYVLFQPGVHGSQGLKPLRQEINEIVRAGSPEQPLPPRLLEAILRLYPLGAGDRQGHAAEECLELPDQCLEWDRSVLDSVLSRVTDLPDEAIDADALKIFFSKLPSVLVDRTAGWAAENPAAPQVRTVLDALAASRDAEALAAAVAGLVELAVAGEPEELRTTALGALSGIDPNAMLLPLQRSAALGRLWGSRSSADLERIFSVDALQEPAAGGAAAEADMALDPFLPNLFALSSPFPGFSAPPENPERSAAFRAAVNAMLRTGGSATDARSEWDYVIQAALKGGAEKYGAIAMRMVYDRSRGADVAAMADRLLDDLAKATIASGLWDGVSAVALEGCSDDAFRNFTERYPDIWRALGSREDRTRIAEALIARDATGGEPFAWLASQLASPLPDGVKGDEPLRYRNHLLAALNAPTSPPSPPLEAALRASLEPHWESRPRQRLQEILLSEALARADEDPWSVVAAIEDTGIVTPSFRRLAEEAPHSVFAQVAARFPWIGLPLAPEAAVYLDSASGYKFDVDVRPEAGGHWIPLRVDEAAMIRFRVPPGITEVAILSMDRDNVVKRLRLTRELPVEPQFVEAGEYAVSLRGVAAAGSAEIFLDDQVMLTVGQQEAPKPLEGIGRYVFDSGANGGTGWFSMTLAADEVLEFETRPFGSGTANPDTVLELIDPESGERLYYDDDGGEVGAFSRLEYVSEGDRDILLRVAAFGGDFGPGERFLLEVGRPTSLAPAAALDDQSWPPLPQ